MLGRGRDSLLRGRMGLARGRGRARGGSGLYLHDVDRVTPRNDPFTIQRVDNGRAYGLCSFHSVRLSGMAACQPHSPAANQEAAHPYGGVTPPVVPDKPGGGRSWAERQDFVALGIGQRTAFWGHGGEERGISRPARFISTRLEIPP